MSHVNFHFVLSNIHRKLPIILFFFYMLSLVICIVSGTSGDFLAYEDSWRLYAAHYNPYLYYRDEPTPVPVFAEKQYHVPVAAYPPLFLVFTWVFLISPILVKLIILHLYWAGVLLLNSTFPNLPSKARFSLLLLLLNPMFIANAAWVSYIDVIVFFFSSLSIYLLIHKRFSSAILVSVFSFLTKFLGLFIPPIIIIHKRFNFRLLLLSVVSYFLAIILWIILFTSSSFYSIVFHVTRPPSKFSLFVILTHFYPAASSFSVFLLLLVSLIILFLFAIHKITWIDSFALLNLSFWTFSKVGHLQFLIMLFPWFILWTYLSYLVAPSPFSFFKRLFVERLSFLTLFLVVYLIFWAIDIEYIFPLFASTISGLLSCLYLCYVFSSSLRARHYIYSISPHLLE